MTVLDQASKAADVAREAFAAGDLVTGIAAIQLAAQLVSLARLFEQPCHPNTCEHPCLGLGYCVRLTAP